MTSQCREDFAKQGLRTLDRTDELRPAVELSGNAGQAGVEPVTGLDKSLAGRDLGPQSLALGTVRIVIHSIRSLTRPIWDGGHLLVRIRNPVCEDDRGKVDLFQTGDGGKGKLLVLPVEGGGGVGSVRSPVAFRSHMERSLGVFWETRKEQLEEGIDILPGCGTTVDL